MTAILLPPRRRLHAHAPGPHDAPRREPDSAHATGARPRVSDARRGAVFAELRVLIVDDDFLFADMLPRLLRKAIEKPRLEIVSAKDPDEAMRRLATQTFDVVICDFDLRAAKTGLDVLAQAGARADGDGATPFRILISGHSPREVPSSDGVLDAFLDKPMTLRAVVPLLTSLLHERLGVEFTLKE